MNKPKYVTRLDRVEDLSASERRKLEPVVEKFVFRANDYYLNLIDWNDPDDPIRRLVIPDEAELNEWGRLDASYEELYTKAPGLEHKYRDTALLLCNDVCGAYCRFCFRKRLFMDGNDEVVKDVRPGLDYIRRHPEINNVLMTGGDPLILSTSRLEPIIAQLREIPHVKIIRLGSKMPAFNPHRIIHDASLHAMFRKYSTPEQGRIYVMCHFNHPRELTAEAREGLDVLQRNGVTTVNQTPMIRGVNDRVEVLRELFSELSFLGAPPYYVFHCRPTEGNESYSLPVEEGFRIFLEAQKRTSGLARRARYSMSHVTGKIEVLALTDEHIIFRYHRAATARNEGKTLVFKRNIEAQWFDDYPESVAYLPELPAASQQLVSIEADMASRA